MHWTQLHLALNHVPVIGIPVLMLILLAGWCRKSPDVQRTALWLFVLFSAASVAIKFTGDFAAEQDAVRLQAATEWVKRHEQTGDRATTGVFFLGLSAAFGLFLNRRSQSVRTWTLALVVVVGLITCVLYTRAAHAGGQISHPELRPNPKANGRAVVSPPWNTFNRMSI